MPAGDRAQHRQASDLRPVPRSGEAGYNLVVLAVMITAVNVLIAAALPYWSSWAKRQKEDELVFRGLQYAEAIRLFQTRQGRFPNQLEELIEVEPRAIRQLWANPMAEDGRWGVLLQSGGGQEGAEGEGGEPAVGITVTRAPAITAVPPGADGEGDVVGSIVGVYSATPGASIRIWNGHRDVQNWLFTSDLIQLRRGEDSGRPPPSLNSDRIGRPFPPGMLEGAMDGSAPEEGGS